MAKSSASFKKGKEHINYGKHLSQEIRDKISESNKGKIYSDETKEKMRKAKLGIPLSEEHKRNLSVSLMGNKNNWWGGFSKSGGGYIIFMPPNGCKFSSMREKSGYIKLHRLVMAEYLQRPLREEEIVHHVNGDLNNNKIENLLFMKNQGRHVGYHNTLRRKG